MSVKNLEDLLRERLGASSRVLPSPGFEDRVRRSLIPRRAGGWRRRHLVEGVVGIAAVMALVAVGVPWMLGPRTGIAGPGASATDDRTAEPTIAPTVTPTNVPLAHAQKWMLSFDYPASWTLTDRDIFQATNGLSSASNEGMPAVFGFVGNGSAQESCVPGGAQAMPQCSTTWGLADNTIVMRFEVAITPHMSREKSPPTYAWTGQEANDGVTIPGAQNLTLDNLPARFVRSATNAVPFRAETVPGATAVLWWGIPSQSTLQFGWTIVAAIRGPNTAELESQAEALVASIHFVSAAQVLPTDPADLERAREAALAHFYAEDKRLANDEHVHELDCFSVIVGEARQANITQTLATNPLTKPLPVTCIVESAVPSAMQGWIVTLSQSWEAGSDYPAGKVSYRVVLRADGQWEGWSLLNAKETLSTSLYPN